jgi:hypothetical protein
MTDRSDCAAPRDTAASYQKSTGREPSSGAAAPKAHLLKPRLPPSPGLRAMLRRYERCVSGKHAPIRVVSAGDMARPRDSGERFRRFLVSEHRVRNALHAMAAFALVAQPQSCPQYTRLAETLCGVRKFLGLPAPVPQGSVNGLQRSWNTALSGCSRGVGVYILHVPAAPPFLMLPCSTVNHCEHLGHFPRRPSIPCSQITCAGQPMSSPCLDLHGARCLHRLPVHTTCRSLWSFPPRSSRASSPIRPDYDPRNTLRTGTFPFSHQLQCPARPSQSRLRLPACCPPHLPGLETPQFLHSAPPRRPHRRTSCRASVRDTLTGRLVKLSACRHSA